MTGFIAPIPRPAYDHIEESQFRRAVEAGLRQLESLITNPATGGVAPTHVLATNTALGVSHTMSGASDGEVLRASGATTAQFAPLAHADLSGVGTDDHHAQSHVLAGTGGLGGDHTVSGLTARQVLIASAATAAGFRALVLADLPAIAPSDLTETGMTVGHVVRATSATTLDVDGGPIRFSNGSAATPSLAPENDPDFGWYYTPGVSRGWSLSIDGTERWRLQAGQWFWQGDYPILLGVGTDFIVRDSGGNAVLHYDQATEVFDVGRASVQMQFNGTKILDEKITGWTLPTGTATRTGFATSTVTTEQLAEHVKALLEDLGLSGANAHGLIGA